MIDYYTRDFSSFQYPLLTTKNHHFFLNLEIAYLLLASPLLLLIRRLFVWNLGLLYNVLSRVVSSAYMMGLNLSLAEHIRQAQMKVFVDKRLSEPPDSDNHLNLKAPIHKNKAKTCILHCIHSHVETIVVAVRDTDVLLLLLAHYGRMGCTRLYMKAGMYFPVHEIQLLLSIYLEDTLLVFHAITGWIVCLSSVAMARKQPG